MKKSTIIILFGLACLVLAGYIATQHLDIADQKKAMASLKRERDMAWNTIKTRDGEISNLKDWVRSLQEAAKSSENKLASFQETVKNLEDTPVNTENQENELDRWLGAIPKLRDFIKQHPEYAIPEFKYLTDKDWLAVTENGQLETEADYRKALAELRKRAKIVASDVLGQSIRDFSNANGGNPPQGLKDIVAYLPADFDSDMIARYANNPSGKIKGLAGDSQQWIIKEVGPIDSIWDTEIWVSNRGGLATRDLSNPAEESAVQAAIKSYEVDHGVAPTNTAQISQYIPQGFNEKNVNEIYKSIMHKSD